MDATRAGPLQDDRYLVLEAVGRGGMGTVYRAFDRVDERIVALKVSDEPGRPGPSHPLAAEFAHWIGLRHPNVVRAHALRLAERGPVRRGSPYLVLEYFRARPVHRSHAPGRWSARALEELARRVLQGLAHVHRAGLVHRDLKAGNVLVGRSRALPGRVKLTDFGLAEPAGARSEPGRLSGSLPYVAPETLLGRRVDGRADLYGLGMLLFFLATGRLAAPGSDPGSIVRWHLSHERPDPRSLRPGLPDRLARFILRLTSRRRDERPASAEEALRGLGSAAPPPPWGTGPAGIDRGELARVRLALDAVRLGARRRIVPCGDGSTRSAVAEEARRLAHVHGLAWHRLGPRRGSDDDPLGRFVSARLCELGGRASRLVERHRLDRFLPLARLDGALIRVAAARPGGLRPEAAARLAAFVLDGADALPLVLHVEPAAAGDPRVGALLDRLRAACAAAPAPRPERGGLLLVEPRGANGRPLSRTGSR